MKFEGKSSDRMKKKRLAKHTTRRRRGIGRTRTKWRVEAEQDTLLYQEEKKTGVAITFKIVAIFF